MKKQHRIITLLSLLGDLAGDLISIVIAAYLIFRYLGGTSKPTADEFSAGILGILTLVAITGLWDRFGRLRRVEKLMEETSYLIQTRIIERVRADEFFVRNKLDDGFFSTATDIAISGITLGNTIREFVNVLGQRLIAGARIRIIILDTSEQVLKQLIGRSWGAASLEHYTGRINITLNLIKILGDTPDAKGTLEVGYLPFVPSFGIISVDANTKNGSSVVEIYHHNSREPSPSFRLNKEKDPYWFGFYNEQFELMWKQCTTKKLLDEGKVILNVK